MHLLYRSKEGRGSGSTFPIGFPPFRHEEKEEGRGGKFLLPFPILLLLLRVSIWEKKEGKKENSEQLCFSLARPLRRHEATKVGGEIGVFGRSVGGGGGGGFN